MDIQIGSLDYLKPKPSSITTLVHNKYNPEGISQFNIVPGLLGVILTMTMVIDYYRHDSWGWKRDDGKFTSNAQ